MHKFELSQTVAIAASGEIKFWFDLQRADRVLEDACRATVELIRDKAGVPLLFGTP